MAYKTSFPTNENPLSQGGIWVQQDPNQTKCAVTTQGGVQVCHGTQAGTGAFDDSQAYLPNNVGNNYTVSAVVYRDPALTNSAPIDEVEILLRCNDTTVAGSMVGNCYELNVGHHGGFANIGRFKGAALVSVGNNTTGSIGFVPADGDIFSASVYTDGSGNVVLTAYWNGLQFMQATDNSATLKILTGAPGLGFFIDTGGNNSQFGFRSWNTSRIVQVGTPVHTGVTNTGSVAVTYTGATAGNLLVATCSMLQASTTAQAAITPTDTNGTFRDIGSPALLLDTPNAVRYGVMQARQENCNAGSHTVTYTFPNGVTYAELSVAEFMNVTIFDKTANSSATVSPITVGPTATLVQSEELSVAGMIAFAGTGSGATGITDPPVGFIKIHAQQNDNLTIGAEHAFSIIVDGTAPSSTWAWTDAGVNDTAAIIGTYRASILGISSYVNTPFAPPPGLGTPYFKRWTWDHSLEQNIGPSVQTTTIAETLGVYTWKGTTSPLSKEIISAIGSWTWVGKNSPLSKEIVAIKGQYTWVGKTSPLSSEIVLTTGKWTWLGTSSPISKSISSSSGAWSWKGSTSTFGSIALITETVGSYSWSGKQSTLSKMINETLGPYTWSGIHATVTTGGTGSTVVFFDGINVADGLTYHKGLSRPHITLISAGGGTFTVTKDNQVTEEKSDSILKETYLIDGDIP